MKQITNKTILKQGNNTFQPVEVDGVVYWTDGKLPKDRDISITFHKDTGLPMVDKEGFYEEDLSYYAYPPKRIVAQSKIAGGWKLARFPFVRLGSYIERLANEYAPVEMDDYDGKHSEYDINKSIRNGVEFGYRSNTNQYTKEDIDKAINMAWLLGQNVNQNLTDTIDLIFEQINSISVIEVDDKFNVISYE